jgi:hypothetical protein
MDAAETVVEASRKAAAKLNADGYRVESFFALPAPEAAAGGDLSHMLRRQSERGRTHLLRAYFLPEGREKGAGGGADNATALLMGCAVHELPSYRLLADLRSRVAADEEKYRALPPSDRIAGAAYGACIRLLTQAQGQPVLLPILHRYHD